MRRAAMYVSLLTETCLKRVCITFNLVLMRMTVYCCHGQLDMGDYLNRSTMAKPNILNFVLTVS